MGVLFDLDETLTNRDASPFGYAEVFLRDRADSADDSRNDAKYDRD
jgi:hypothetical protein